MKLVWKKNWLLTISHREYLLTQIWRGFTRHQRGAILGRAWLLIQPLAIIMVYTLIFTEVMHARLEVAQGPHAYSLFLCAALLPWQFFAEVLQRTQQSLLDHAAVIRKTSVPLGVFFLIPLGVASLNFLVMFILFALWALVVAEVSIPSLLMMLPWVVLQVLLAWVWGIALAIAHVFFRDVGQLLALILQFGFWMTPIVYPLNILPTALKDLILMVNPIAVLALQEQHALLPLAVVEVSSNWWVYGVWLILGVVLANRLLRRQASEVVDVL